MQTAIELRDYQREVIEEVERRGPGRWLVQLFTGAGKTVIFASLIDQWLGAGQIKRALLLSHRQELVEQPVKYFSHPVGIERGDQRAGWEPVVSASVQTMVKRLDQFDPEEFDLIIIDEAHHAAASTYRKIIDYFRPDTLLGFTATPNRGDGVRLDDVFEDIIVEKDFLWGIENEWLCPVRCYRVDIGYDLAAVRTQAGDYAVGDLEKALSIEGATRAIAEAHERFTTGPTMIFAVSVAHAEDIAKAIPGAVALSAKSKERAEVLERFRAGSVSTIVNCMLFTEGTDLPMIETLIVARPTKSAALYVQMVGRGMRTHDGKQRLTLVDCVGASSLDMCTAPTLVGFDLEAVPEEALDEIEGDLMAELPAKIETRGDTPRTWIRNVQIVRMFAKRRGYRLHDVRWFKHGDGRLTLELPRGRWMEISRPDLRGRAILRTYAGKGRPVASERMQMQKCLDWAFEVLRDRAGDERQLWSLSAWQKWGGAPATEKQRALISRFFRGADPNGFSESGSLTKGEAALILDRVLSSTTPGGMDALEKAVA